MPYLDFKASLVIPVFPFAESTPEALIGELVAILSRFSTHGAELICSELVTKVGGISTYSEKTLLIQALQMVVAYLRRTDLSEDEKRAIAIELIKNTRLPAGNYHDLVNDVLLKLTRFQSMDHILMLIRTHIVADLAETFPRKDLHNCTFFNVANTLGYGVPRIYATPSRGESRPATRAEMLPVEEAIKTAFEKKYDALSILDVMQSFIEINLEMLGYNGKKAITEAYEAAFAENIALYLKTLLSPDQAYTVNDFFVTPNGEFTDLNWSFIQNCLWKELNRKGYIIFETREKILMSALYGELAAETAGAGAGAGAGAASLTRASAGPSGDDSTPSFIELMKDKAYRDLLCSFLIQHPQLIRSLEQRENILRILSESNTEVEVKDVLDYAQLVHAFFPDNKEFREAVLALLAKKCLEKAAHQHMLCDVKLASNCYAACLYLALPDDVFNALFKDNLLILKALLSLGLAHSQKLFIRITTYLSSLSVEAQTEILLEKNSNGENVLTAAVMYQPQAVSPLLRIINPLLPIVKKDLLISKVLVGSYKNYTALMLAVRLRPEFVSEFLAAISTLPAPDQREILTTTVKGENAFMLARYNTAALDTLLTFFQTLPYSTQKAISNQGFITIETTATGNEVTIHQSTFMFLFNESLISRLSGVDLVSQLIILNEPAKYLDEARTYKEQLITRTIEALGRSESSTEKAIYRVLQSSSDAKKEATILSLYQIKKSLRAGTTIDAAINDALTDPENELYKALNMWGTLSLQGSLAAVQTAARAATSAAAGGSTATADSTAAAGAGATATAGSTAAAAGAGTRGISGITTRLGTLLTFFRPPANSAGARNDVDPTQQAALRAPLLGGALEEE